MPRVSIEGLDKVFEITEGEVLYDALYDRGLELPHGCLSGSCGACRVEILNNPTHLNPPGVIESDTIASVKDELKMPDANIRLACRAKVNCDFIFKTLK